MNSLPRDDKTLALASRRAGVDLMALRNKYRTVPSENTNHSSHNLEIQECSKSVESGTTRLEQYKICPGCNGQGTVKSLYNFIVMERTCDKCDGDSVIMLKDNISSDSNT